jgi:hypothetical protein
MKDANLFQLGIGLETGAQEEDTARGIAPACDHDIFDDARDDHFIRDGQTVDTFSMSDKDNSESRMIHSMVGRSLDNLFPPRTPNIGEEVFRVEDWNAYHPVDTHRQVVHDASFYVRAGEVVGFAGLMAFIYSDLMVPPLVKVNARYYGWKVALFIAGIMYVSIVATALLLDTSFGLLGMRPESAAGDVTEQQFAIDYTFFFNIAFVLVAALLITLHRRHLAASEHGDHDGDNNHDHGGGGGIDIQKYVAWLAIFVLISGMVAFGLGH